MCWSYYQLLELYSKIRETWPIPSSCTCFFSTLLLIIWSSHIHSGSICGFFINLSFCLAYYSIFPLFFFKTLLFIQERQTQNNQNQNKKIVNPYLRWNHLFFNDQSQWSFPQSYNFLKYYQVHYTLEVQTLHKKWPAFLNFYST